MNIVRRLNSALDQGVSKQVFDHVRNYMICALILAIGTTELREKEAQFFDLIPPGYSGLGVVALGVLLILFNLYDGIRRISRSPHHRLLIAALIVLYLFMTARIVEMAWDFRDPGDAPGELIGIEIRSTGDGAPVAG